MWIQGSTLSISQRTLPPERPLSPIQSRAQELATNVIQSYSARHTIQDALEFIKDISPIEIVLVDEHARLIPRSPPLPSLNIPAQYGVKGGAARECLVATLNLRAPRQPRDIDLVRRGPHRKAEDDAVAQRFMGRDFQLGARVELIRNLDGYLASRDLTINEVVAIDNSVSASLLCVLDTIGQTIRPSRYRGGSLHRKPSLHGQSLLKMARLFSEGACSQENWTITGIPDEVAFSEFDLAIHLNKAFQRGRIVADTFLRTCEILSLIPASEDRIRNALERLEHLRHGERGLFPDIPTDEWQQILRNQIEIDHQTNSASSQRSFMSKARWKL